MSVIEKAKTLGEAIANSKELEELKNSEARMSVDPAASDIIKEFQAKQQELQQLQMQGQQMTDDHKKSVELIEGKMKSNESISSYMEAQQNFEKLLQEVNQIISASISGQDCSEGDCSSGCSSC